MKKKSILLIRLDKIGDLICTLPVDQILDDSVYDVTWIIQKGLAQIVELGEKKRRYHEIDKSNSEAGKAQIAKILRENHFDIAISFQSPWWINFELFKQRIPKRIGVLSQWHSFLFLNQGIRQKRSRALQHEFDYNLDLVKKLTGPLNKENKEILFKFKKPVSSDTLAKYDLPAGRYTVVHPGMLGSALNWPQDKYIEYIKTQILHGDRVVITGTDSDILYLLKIKQAFPTNEKDSPVVWLQSKLSFPELLQILYFAKKVVAPSTGVAHVAASLDQHVQVIFSPVQVHLPRRWAPRGPHVEVFWPHDTPCPAIHQCLRERCPFFNCMNTIEI